MKFSSSVRFELMKDMELVYRKNPIPYRVRVVFDNEEIWVPGCSNLYCEFSEFKDFMSKTLEFDVAKIASYCEGGVENYENELKYRP